MPTVISPQLPLLELLPSLGTCQFYLLKLARLKRFAPRLFYRIVLCISVAELVNVEL
jgi:hypothetical protein